VAVNPNAINTYILAGSIGYAVISFFFFVMSFFH
jgi:hypothetical protein